MTTPSEIVAELLGQVSAEHTRTIPTYLNTEVTQRAGRQLPRYLSDYGFPVDINFSYVMPHPAHMERTEDRRNINGIVLGPVGLADDRSRLMRRPPHQRIATASGPRSNGVTLFDHNQVLYVVNATIDASTSSQSKRNQAAQRMALRNAGPAFHFLVARNGDVVVGAPLDAITTAFGTRFAEAVTVGLETLLLIPKESYDASNYSTIFEAPYTAPQLLSLYTIIKKLRTAIPAIPLTFSDSVGGAGLSYWVPEEGPSAFNFIPPGRTDFAPSNFSYAYSQRDNALASINAFPEYELATQIFRLDGRPAEESLRGLARAAIANVDTVVEQSPILAQYADLAALERANEMQATLRRQVFVHRVRQAHTDATAAASGASAANEAGRVASGIPAAVTGSGPHVYNYATGMWGDGRTY